MTNIRRLLAANIRTYRHEAGLTQAKLAELADTATHYIAMLEGGKNFPSPEMIERLAGVLGKDSTDLFMITPVQNDWKETILSDIERLITDRLNDIKHKEDTKKPPVC